ncbi:MAG: CvpA family protein [Patescibacteria group bacterium]
MFSLNGNWVDLVIILILIYFASEAWRYGLWFILTDFISFLGALLISLRAYKFAAGVLKSNFNLSHSLANAIGFLVTAIVLEATLGYILGALVTRFPKKLIKASWSRFLGLLPALGEGIVLISFILTLIVGLPVAPSLKRDVTDSKIGSFLLRQTSGTEKFINEVFGGVIEDSLTYLIIKPGSKESVPIAVERTELAVDAVSESEMFRLVNKERRERGLPELVWAPDIVPIARAHAKDMWERKYFSHYSPEGDDVGDRLDRAGISYHLAGENLALAPTFSTAHTGFMNSEGHRVNILEPKFKRVGIGVIDNGIYGKMFVQVFTD